jgi:hypothetical protein
VAAALAAVQAQVKAQGDMIANQTALLDQMERDCTRLGAEVSSQRKEFSQKIDAVRGRVLCAPHFLATLQQCSTCDDMQPVRLMRRTLAHTPRHCTPLSSTSRANNSSSPTPGARPPNSLSLRLSR